MELQQEQCCSQNGLRNGRARAEEPCPAPKDISVQVHPAQLTTACNKALSVWAQYFQNRFVFALFNPLLLRLICSFIPQWKEVKKYLFKKTYRPPLSHYGIYRGTGRPSQSVAVVLPQAHTCFDLKEPSRWAELCSQEVDSGSTPHLQSPVTPWDVCTVQKGRLRSMREAGSLWPMGESIQPSVTHPSSSGQWGLVTMPRSPEEKVLTLCEVARRGFGNYLCWMTHLSRGKGEEFALTGMQTWSTSLPHVTTPGPTSARQSFPSTVRSSCSFFQILVLFQLCHTETIFFFSFKENASSGSMTRVWPCCPWQPGSTVTTCVRQGLLWPHSAAPSPCHSPSWGELSAGGCPARAPAQRPRHPHSRTVKPPARPGAPREILTASSCQSRSNKSKRGRAPTCLWNPFSVNSCGSPNVC